MRHLTLGLLVALMIGGCVYDDQNRYNGYYYPDCQKFTSCTGCTQALGCGWCYSGSTAVCLSSPSQCSRLTTFTWTWEDNFCPGGAAVDGGIDRTGPSDGGTSSDVDGGIGEAASDGAVDELTGETGG
jgi:hypothetical protein